jgi:hypothetical protein
MMQHMNGNLHKRHLLRDLITGIINICVKMMDALFQIQIIACAN